MNCKKCGIAIPEEAAFCPGCGAKKRKPINKN